jgi:phage gpG-like protein
VQIDVEVRAKEPGALLHKLSGRLERPQLVGLIDTLVQAQQDRFAGRAGARWRKLAASTVREHARHGRGPQPLVLTGRLMRSLTQRGAPGQQITIRPGELRFGTRVWYARFHQKGQGVPRRTVVGATRVLRARLVDELRRLLFDHL